MIFSRMLIALGLVLATATVGAEPLVDGDSEAGQKKAGACATCHGPQGNSSNPQWPNIAGQSAPYLLQQLQHFKSGKRPNSVMAGQVAGLSEQDMKDLAAHFAGQPAQPAGAADEGLVQRGGKLYRTGDDDAGIPASAGCHGPSGLGNAAAAYPRIGGQHAQYVATQLKAYRDGERGEYPAASIMRGVAEELSDDDIKALASYVQGLHPRMPASEESDDTE